MADLRKDFSRIYDQNVRGIYRFLFLKVNSSEVAKDLTSQTFLKGWEAFRKSEIKDQKSKIENPSAFLYQIARNLAIDYYRKKGRAEIISTDTEDLVIEDPKSNREIFAKKMTQDAQMEKIKRSLGKLKGDYQNVIIWHYLDDFSVPEIAKILNKSKGAVKIMVHRALKQLKQEIQK